MLTSTRLSILTGALGAALALAACGQNTERQTAASAEPAAPVQRPAEEPRERSGGFDETELKPLLLSGDRYLEEMISAEISEAYRLQRGDYIDPQRVIELLRSVPARPMGGELRVSAADESNPEPPESDEAFGTPKTWRISYLAHNEAMDLYRKGDIAAAARRWRDIPTDARALTISARVDCNPSILKQTFAALSELDAPVFLLPEAVDDRECYRVCVGIFQIRAEADFWLSRVKTFLPTSYPFIHVLSREENDQP